MTADPIWAVIDPNVLVAAYITLGTDSTPAGILRKAREGRVIMIGCPALQSELREVLLRPKFRQYGSIARAEAYCAAIDSLVYAVPDPAVIAPVVKGDPDDDYLIALALGRQAAALVTGDRAVLATQVADLRIVTPRAFLDWTVCRC